MNSVNVLRQLSIIDRLNPKIKVDNIQPEIMIASIVQDLENLLNTRNNGGLTEVDESLANSILNYGLADFSLFNLSAADDQMAFCQHIERLISRYEPRLKFPKVTIQPPSQEFEFRWYFQINAELELNDHVHRITVSSTLNLHGGRYSMLGAHYE